MIVKIIFMFAAFIQIGISRSPIKESVSIRIPHTTEDAQYWIDLGQADLQETLRVKLNENIAKNVILFIGDGMSIATVTSARILKGQRDGQPGEEGYLEFEKFPHSGLVKTYCRDYQVPDSASTATALLTGVKTNLMVLGLDGSAVTQNCKSQTNENKISGIGSWSQQTGKRTGIVTTTRVTHASPASVYAHSTNRFYECDDNLPVNVRRNCPEFKDIARQLIEDEPGSKFNVIMGGGLSLLDGDAIDMPHNTADGCTRQDGRNLWREWLQEKQTISANSHFVQTKSELLSLDAENTDYLMGIFANNHMPYEHIIRENDLNMPTLSEMVESAINVLDKGNNGYFLFVESGKIDTAHHENQAKIALDETIVLSHAVAAALNLTNSKDTLIVVTADHSHTMTLSGYPKRGNSILGVAGRDSNRVGYTTLQYANGPSYNITVVDDEIVRPDPNYEDTTDYNYRYQAANPEEQETHGAEDVPVYANGPMAHLFQGVMEQNFIAHAMAYASCVGQNLDHCTQDRIKENKC